MSSPDQMGPDFQSDAVRPIPTDHIGLLRSGLERAYYREALAFAATCGYASPPDMQPILDQEALEILDRTMRDPEYGESDGEKSVRPAYDEPYATPPTEKTSLEAESDRPPKVATPHHTKLAAHIRKLRGFGENTNLTGGVPIE